MNEKDAKRVIKMLIALGDPWVIEESLENFDKEFPEFEYLTKKAWRKNNSEKLKIEKQWSKKEYLQQIIKQKHKWRE